ncbi:hypothetical protein FZC66_14460 [Priestia megaterium]|nr:hypothetical protein FZC66_14460 [Priestia megaterium]
MNEAMKSLPLNTIVVIITLSIPLILTQIYVPLVLGWALLIISPIISILAIINIFRYHLYSSS